MLCFIGKSGVAWDRTVESPVLAKFVTERKGLVEKPTDKLWPDVDSKAYNSYLGSISGDKYTAKDFRNLHATRVAMDYVKPFAGQAFSNKDRSRIMTEASTAASQLLGNTPGEAKAKYINPATWDVLLLKTKKG